jgi:hypothetical protein
MIQPDKLNFVPDWAYKTAEVKFLKIFKLCFYSEWRGNGEHKHFISVYLFGKWKLVHIEARTGVTKDGFNNYLPRIYKPKKLFSRFNKDLTDKHDKFLTIKFPSNETAIVVEDSEIISKFEFSNHPIDYFKLITRKMDK